MRSSSGIANPAILLLLRGAYEPGHASGRDYAGSCFLKLPSVWPAGRGVVGTGQAKHTIAGGTTGSHGGRDTDCTGPLRPARLEWSPEACKQ